MIKTIKKVLLGSLSILGISFLIWTFLLLNPKWSYANKTQYDKVTIYHNQALAEETQAIVNAAMDILKTADLYSEEVAIELCFNDGSFYPNLHPLVGGPTAYALFNKTVLHKCTPNFKENIAETQWAVNNYELRKFNLTWLLAHEFTHNLQFKANPKYVIRTTLGTLNWKLEGHAEYVSRQFKNDGQLKEKIKQLQEEQSKPQNGLPVFLLTDGTRQILSYFKYALVVQYLIEQEGRNFEQICQEERSLEAVYADMMEWYEN